MTGRVLRLPANTHGRDFVIGDIHGAYDTVLRGMRAVNFNKKTDRLFCVGDLIDRGPGSHRCVDFLKQPYVFACRGNHDENFVSMDVAGLKVLGGANFHGLKWVCDQTDSQLEAVRKSLAQLPIIIEIETPRGLVGLVHADVPAGMSWQEFVSFVEAGDEKAIKVALEGRKRVDNADASGVLGIGRVFIGHTINWTGPQALGNVFAIDTGACFHELTAGKTLEEDHRVRGALTMLNLQFSTQSLAAAQTSEKGLRVLDETVIGPFGSSSVGPAPVRERQRA
jgi:serine/threonine protein phosphatase 1